MNFNHIPTSVNKEQELNKLPIISRCFCRIQGARRKHNELCAQRGRQKTAKKAIIMGKLFDVRSLAKKPWWPWQI